MKSRKIKNMRHYLHIALVLALLGTVSCRKDFLDVQDKTSILRQAYVKDLATTGEYLNGIYIELSSDFYSAATIIYPDLVADNIKPVAGGSLLASHYSWNQLTDNEQMLRFDVGAQNANGLWLSGYRIIRDCNFIIETIDQYRSQNPARADDFKGQAFALRALVHSVLVNTFAQPYSYTANASHLGVPYIVSSDYRQTISRASVAEVYSKMIEDLGSAIQLLPAVSENTLFVSRNAAMALLARIMLAKGDFSAAKNLAAGLATHVPAMKIEEGYPSRLFTLEEKEALFQLPPAAFGHDGASHTSLYAAYYFSSSSYFFMPTDDVVRLLREDARDVRSAWVNQSNGSWSITKYPAGVVEGFPIPEIAYYQTVLRSSEMYLVAAEAYAQLSNEDSARFYLDAIRMRANSYALPVNATGASLLDSIYKERRKEFAFEGNRMFDLLRWQRKVFRSDESDPSVKELPFPSNRAICPIPLSDVTTAGLQQNPGY